MKTPYILTPSDLAFASAYADISPHPEELIQQVITQLMAIEGNGPRSTEIAAAYCVWNCGVEYGKSLPDAEPDDDVQDEFQPRGYIPMPHSDAAFWRLRWILTRPSVRVDMEP
jgi:hypothetical protein